MSLFFPSVLLLLPTLLTLYTFEGLVVFLELPQVFEEAFTHSGTALLARLEADMDDGAATELAARV